MQLEVSMVEAHRVVIRLLADGAVPVNVNLVRNGGEYVAPPKPAYTAFSGQGRTLSGVKPLPPACQTWLCACCPCLLMTTRARWSMHLGCRADA